MIGTIADSLCNNFVLYRYSLFNRTRRILFCFVCSLLICALDAKDMTGAAYKSAGLIYVLNMFNLTLVLISFRRLIIG